MEILLKCWCATYWFRDKWVNQQVSSIICRCICVCIYCMSYAYSHQCNLYYHLPSMTVKFELAFFAHMEWTWHVCILYFSRLLTTQNSLQHILKSCKVSTFQFVDHPLYILTPLPLMSYYNNKHMLGNIRWYYKIIVLIILPNTLAIIINHLFLCTHKTLMIIASVIVNMLSFFLNFSLQYLQRVSNRHQSELFSVQQQWH